MTCPGLSYIHHHVGHIVGHLVNLYVLHHHVHLRVHHHVGYLFSVLVNLHVHHHVSHLVNLHIHHQFCMVRFGEYAQQSPKVGIELLGQLKS